MKSKVAGMGYYVPENVIRNEDLEKLMDTTDAWIQERTGIKERRYGTAHVETTSTMGAKAAEIAIQRAGINKEDIDFIIFATLSPDYFFPGCGVLLQRELKMTKQEAPALDVRNQCSGFLYGLSIADQFIKTGQYKNILLVGAEMHSMGLDFTTRGRNVSVIFGDGAGAFVIQPTENEEEGIINTVLHSDGTYAEELASLNPGSHGGHHLGKEQFGYPEQKYGGIFLTQKMWDDQLIFPNMNGPLVFKTAVIKFQEVIQEALQKAGLTSKDINMLIPHQANLRISQFIQQKLELRDDQVWNNIQKYGNTTAATIPIAVCEAWEAGKINKGDLICLAAFGSGFTWGSALIKW
ncbi:MAG: ketoacyl-ACP synthase III [Saprospiraceae bacterium]|nr:ketoacyl-ACP synthase III [Saprospiraceae bacterium]MBK8484061.1 ketoacyl-ACP synthase III [Saprospiraceae bacterium]MBK9221464.1 ketoacyl-ACP synthase III [Saprospiraceae bacterium]MBK9721598.1 ketoacyl-ACP synthase III [Saprospiraceae bacterium]MBK9728663.1 ketoacyl-ACP synthase III [Saprospiraceae bacterium]